MPRALRYSLGLAALALAAITIAPAAARPVQATAHSAQIIEPSFNPESWGYAPGRLSVRAGDSVSWVNSGAAPHTVTADDGSFDSGFMLTGQSWSFTPSAAGVYSYYCTLHPAMRSVLVVEE